MYCKKCGGKLESYASNCAFCGAPVEKYDTKMEYVKQETKKEVKPMTAWKWIGLDLINVIPVVGWIIYLVLMFKWSFGSTNDLSLKGYAIYKLILIIIAILLVAGMVVMIMLNPELLEELKQELKRELTD